MLKLTYLSFVIVVCLSCSSAASADKVVLTVEELRITAAQQAMPDVVNRHQSNIESFSRQLLEAKTIQSLTEVVQNSSRELWKNAINSYVRQMDFDDRPLYWARLQTSRALRQSSLFNNLSSELQENLLWQLELLTRGQHDIEFDKKTNKKILVTGFDPFFLDRHIGQSNPSGAVAMALDDFKMNIGGQIIELESLIVPVRFADFDKGMIEELLTPYLQNTAVDMIITISMGRDDFDLERFPGLRRSAKAPDNLNVYTGANAKTPLIPLLKNQPLKGPEFLEFSLPAASMKKVPGDFKINDNHKITSTEKSYSPKLISELSDQISVQGSGGGYLSNEISYRSLRLRNIYNPELPVGHIHTPRFKGFEPDKTKKIIQQIKVMITAAASQL